MFFFLRKCIKDFSKECVFLETILSEFLRTFLIEYVRAFLREIFK